MSSSHFPLASWTPAWALATTTHAVKVIPHGKKKLRGFFSQEILSSVKLTVNQQPSKRLISALSLRDYSSAWWDRCGCGRVRCLVTLNPQSKEADTEAWAGETAHSAA